jgi:hypothetical protein
MFPVTVRQPPLFGRSCEGALASGVARGVGKGVGAIRAVCRSSEGFTIRELPVPAGGRFVAVRLERPLAAGFVTGLDLLAVSVGVLVLPGFLVLAVSAVSACLGFVTRTSFGDEYPPEPPKPITRQ